MTALDQQAESFDFRTLAESIPNMVWSARADGVFDYLNQRFLQYLGKTLAEVQAGAWAEDLHPEDRQQSIDKWAESLATGVAFATDYRIRRGADGRYVWHAGRALPLRDETGRVVRWFGTCTDIEDRKLAEEELHAVHRQLNLALQAASAGVWEWRYQSNELYWSDGLCRIFGLVPGTQAISYHSWQKTIYPEDLSRIMAPLGVAINSHQRLEMEYRIVLPSGELRWIYDLGDTFFDDGGQPQGRTGICVDITSIKQAAEENFRNRSLLEMLAENISDFLYVKDPAGRYLMINPSALQALGKRAEEVIGHDDTTIFPAEMLDLVMESDRRVIETGSVARHEMPITLPTGKTITASVVKGPLRDSAGEIVGIFGVTRDISDYKETERLLRDNERYLRDEVARRTAELEASNEKLRALAERIETVAEHERRLIGQEVHDDLGQLITALRLNIAWLNKHHASRDQRVVTRFADTEKLIELTLASIERIVRNLRPRMLDELGLVATIQSQLADYRALGLECRFRVVGSDTTLDAERALSLYRSYQEGMTNILRHAGATRATIIIGIDAKRVRLRIADNGCGIGAGRNSSPRSLGIVGMRERAERWGGTMTIAGRSRGGTALDIMLPRGATADADRAGRRVVPGSRQGRP